MGDGNSFPLVVCVFQVILAYESIVLCMRSGKYIDIYFHMKITFQIFFTSATDFTSFKFVNIQ